MCNFWPLPCARASGTRRHVHAETAPQFRGALIDTVEPGSTDSAWQGLICQMRFGPTDFVLA
jgi:hypothetical protein